jgi:prepilin-type N-terminal cleavage/methylation domain-containing protein
MKATRTNFQAGFTLVEMMVVVAIIGLLAAIVSPNFVSARGTGQAKTSINYPSDFTPDLRLNPAGGIYSESAVSALPAGSLGDLATLAPPSAVETVR